MEGTTMVAVVSVVFIVTTAATAILRPLMRQLGSYLDALTLQRQGNTVNSADALKRIEESLLTVQEELAKAREEREFLAQLYPLASRSLPGSARQGKDGPG